MPSLKFCLPICLSVCIFATASADDDTAVTGANAYNPKENPYSKTFLMSADGKYAFAVQASQTDLGRQLANFLLEPSRQLELASFRRETFETRKLSPQKHVLQLLTDSQNQNKGPVAKELETILHMLNAEQPIDAVVPLDELQLLQEDRDKLRDGLFAKNLVLRSDGHTNILRWSNVSMKRELFQFEGTGQRLRPIEGTNLWNEVWPSCLRGFLGDRHRLTMGKLEKGILCDSISSTYAVSFRCASLQPFQHHFSLFWIVDGNLHSVMQADREEKVEPWKVIMVR